ncbi:ABC transporter substrate-binding protein, partial [Riemerella anatipestifer]|nr:ABC transporter substrate-binding protein [Riemerella anatipestifer]
TDRVATFYKERYNVVTADSDIIYMSHLDEPIVMGMGYNSTLGFHVIYTKK